ncbi:retrotransposon protein, putative, ty1-copia subclass [Tanacetum coccineum]
MRETCVDLQSQDERYVEQLEVLVNATKITQLGLKSLMALLKDFVGGRTLEKETVHVYLARLLKKRKQVGSASSSGFRIERNAETSFKECVLYFNAIPSNGIYEIDMHMSCANVNSIYNVSNKRVKHNLDSTYLWHCRLAHINKKRIKQLQQDGLLKSTDDESFDKCESCLSGKMTKKHFPHSNERAKDLFENQLGKTIKAIRSDRGGEYISQEFKDYLKANGIVQQLTPPYTPQHNGVSERRNRTLLDMVRSMMNLTTLPLSFWDYALESATRILNMALVKRDTPANAEQRFVQVNLS